MQLQPSLTMPVGLLGVIELFRQNCKDWHQEQGEGQWSCSVHGLFCDMYFVLFQE